MLLFSHLELSDSVIPWTAACQTPLFSITSQSLLKLMSIELVISPFSFCLQPFPAAGSFPVSQLFASGGQIIGASASASVLPTFRVLISFRIDWFDLLAVQGTLQSLLQCHNLKASILRCSAFFMVQLSHPYMTTGKNHSFDYLGLCRQSDVSAF